MQQPDSTIEYRFKTVEQQLETLKSQLAEYVRVREHDLQLGNISSTVERVEREVQGFKQEVQALSGKLAAQEAESERRDAIQRESQASLQIKVLWGIVSVVITVLTAVLVVFLTGRLF